MCPLSVLLPREAPAHLPPVGPRRPSVAGFSSVQLDDRASAQSLSAVSTEPLRHRLAIILPVDVRNGTPAARARDRGGAAGRAPERGDAGRDGGEGRVRAG